jgi:hypothetical protein
MTLVLASCGAREGRYRQLTVNPEAHGCGDDKPVDCGLAVLDTETGRVFYRDKTFWWEENPQTGELIGHQPIGKR